MVESNALAYYPKAKFTIEEGFIGLGIECLNILYTKIKEKIKIIMGSFCCNWVPTYKSLFVVSYPSN